MSTKNLQKHRADNKKYYNTLAAKPVNKGGHYTAAEIEMITKKEISDREIAAKIGRTIAGIEGARQRKDVVRNNAPRKYTASATYISEAEYNAQLEEGESC